MRSAHQGVPVASLPGSFDGQCSSRDCSAAAELAARTACVRATSRGEQFSDQWQRWSRQLVPQYAVRPPLISMFGAGAANAPRRKPQQQRGAAHRCDSRRERPGVCARATNQPRPRRIAPLCFAARNRTVTTPRRRVREMASVRRQSPAAAPCRARRDRSAIGRTSDRDDVRPSATAATMPRPPAAHAQPPSPRTRSSPSLTTMRAAKAEPAM